MAMFNDRMDITQEAGTVHKEMKRKVQIRLAATYCDRGTRCSVAETCSNCHEKP